MSSAFSAASDIIMVPPLWTINVDKCFVHVIVSLSTIIETQTSEHLIFH